MEGDAARGARMYGPAVELVSSLPSTDDPVDAVHGTTNDVSLTDALKDLSEAVVVKNCSSSADEEQM